MKKIVISLFCLILFAQTALAVPAKGLASKDEAKAVSESCLKLILAQDVAGAFNLLKPIFPIPENEINMLQMQTLQQLDMVGQRFGAALGFEFISQEEIKDIFVKFTYIEKFENHAIRWVFTFYKPKDQWYLNNIGWDDQITQLFK